MAITAKLRKRKWKNFTTIQVEVVDNFRRQDNGEPFNICVAYLGAIRETEIRHPLKQMEFWQKAEKGLTRLLCEKRINISELNKIRNKIGAQIARPQLLNQLAPKSITETRLAELHGKYFL